MLHPEACIPRGAQADRMNCNTCTPQFSGWSGSRRFALLVCSFWVVVVCCLPRHAPPLHTLTDGLKIACPPVVTVMCVHHIGGQEVGSRAKLGQQRGGRQCHGQ